MRTYSPCGFIGAAHRELVADFAAERARLCKPQFVLKLDPRTAHA
jgi:hypothetical protein